jgi:hypothetical protein
VKWGWVATCGGVAIRGETIGGGAAMRGGAEKCGIAGGAGGRAGGGADTGAEGLCLFGCAAAWTTVSEEEPRRTATTKRANMATSSI